MRGAWEGDEEIVLIMPSSIKKKNYRIYFDFGEYGTQPINNTRNVDTKTISFRTPRCPLLPGNNDVIVSIVVQENQSPINTIQFCYMTRMLFKSLFVCFLSSFLLAIRTILNLCPRCQENGMNNSMSNKRRWQCDNGVHNVLSGFEKLSIGQVS